MKHTFSRFQRWIEVREKISDLYKPIKKCSRYAHESIKPRLYGTGALEVGAEKILVGAPTDLSTFGPKF